MKAIKPAQTRRPIVAALNRITAALCGGYALANLLPLALAGLLPIERADAAMTALLLSFAVYATAIIWAFAAHSAWRAWAGLLVSTVLAGMLLAVQRGGHEIGDCAKPAEKHGFVHKVAVRWRRNRRVVVWG